MTSGLWIVLVLAAEPFSSGQGAGEDAAAETTPLHLWLRAHDADGDGRVSKDEIPHRLLKKFEKADENRDGFLDARELLYGRTKVSAEARKTENLRLAGGRLAPRGRAGEAVLAASAQLHRQAAQTDPDARIPISPAPVNDPFERQAVPNPAEPGAVAPAALPPTGARKRGGDGLPTAEQVMANLDKDGNGVLDPSEAVDRLARNFAMLDKDKSGTLDREEVERGLRLARIFGVKPDKDPRTYQRVPTSGDASAPAGPDTLGPAVPARPPRQNDAGAIKSAARNGGYL